MVFRRACNADLGQIKELVFSVLREYGLAPDSSGIDRDLEDLEEFYFSHRGYFEVLELGGKIIGTFGLNHLSDQTCELRKMYLSDKHRGKGLGKTLLTRAIEKARDLGFAKIQLETASALKEAIELYKKFGFKPIEAKHLANRCDQAYELILSPRD
ncbi:MAG: GNAT family N-acetyltransferase [Bdellovibrionota bacterium]